MLKLTVSRAARLIGLSPQALRIMLQRNLVPFGIAYKNPGSKSYTYFIYPEKFREYCGLSTDWVREAEKGVLKGE